MTTTHDAETTDPRPSGGAGNPADGDRAGSGISSARRGGGDGGTGDIHDMRTALSDQALAARNLLAVYADVLAGDEQAVADTIEGETDLRSAIEVAVDRIASNDSLVSAIKDRVDALTARRKRLEAQTDTLRTAIGVAMEVATIKRLELADGTVTLKATPASALVLDEAAIPAKFWKPQDPKLDKRAVLDALKASEPVPGATLSNGGSTVQIRRS